MDRRHFLRSLALLSTAAVLDPEKLLWVPGKKTIFLPKHNEFTSLYLVQGALEQLKNDLVFVSRDGIWTYDGSNTIQIGETIRIKKPTPANWI